VRWGWGKVGIFDALAYETNIAYQQNSCYNFATFDELDAESG